MQLSSTSDVASSGVKMLVYGEPGSGKTYAISTLPDPVVLSAEAGLLSLAAHDIPYIQIRSLHDMHEAYAWLSSGDCKHVTVAIDSISEVAEVVLAAEKKRNKDGRAAYGEMQSTMSALVRAFRDLPKHIYMSAKVEKSQDTFGSLLYSPAMPGAKAAQQLPYFFDEVFALRVTRTDDGIQRMLQTQPDGQWVAKDRSGKLDAWTAPDLGAVIGGICGQQG